jgi:hypothetical protein
MFLSGDGIDAIDADGDPEAGDSFLLVMHMGKEPASVRLPHLRPEGFRFEILVDTGSWEVPLSDGEELAAGESLSVEPLSILVLRAS